VVFQLKGSALLWLNMLLPHLNMVVDDVSWEFFKEWLHVRYLCKELLSIISMNSMPYDKSVARCLSTRPVRNDFVILRTNLPRNLRSRSSSFTLLLEFNFYFGYREYWTEESVLDCGEPYYQHYCPEEGSEHVDQSDPLPWDFWARPIRFM
jgi:hypothetical protein